MTDTELTTLSTILWLVGTGALFILLAGWSTRTDWGITSGLVDGVRGWSRRATHVHHASTAGELPALDLAPIDLAALDRRGQSAWDAPPGEASAAAELEDLWTRDLRR